jgi:hypothetical protein
MASKKQKKGNGAAPDVKCKSGVFQLSAWKKEKVVPAKNDYDIERVFQTVSVCLSVGMKKGEDWENVQAWFRASQLADLKEVVDEFAEQVKKLNGSSEEVGGLR